MGTYSCHVDEVTNLPSDIYSWCYVTMMQFRDSGYKRYICSPLNMLINDAHNTLYTACESYKDSDEKLIWQRVNDGGDADTIDGFHANEIASNPNLLINPDFKINQRGKTEYTGAIFYTIDRWKKVPSAATVKVVDKGVTLSFDLSNATYADIRQVFGTRLETGNYTVSIGINDADYHQAITVVSGGFAHADFANSVRVYISIDAVYIRSFTPDEVTINYIKLEYGSNATKYLPPDPTTELLKCQRYYYALDTTTPSADILNTIVGIAGNREWMPLGYTFNVEMQRIPDITITYISKWNAANVDLSGTLSMSSPYTTKNGIPALKSDSNGLDAGTTYYIKFIADAEI